MALASAWADLLDLVLPRRCAGCGGPDGGLCAGCVPGSEPFAVDVGLPARAASAYDGPLRRALLAYKERGRRDLARPLAELLTAAVAEAMSTSPEPVWLIGPPSTRAAAAQRGGDHVLRLARLVARHDPRLHAASGVLRATRRVRDSAGLGIDERARNLSSAFVAGPAHGRTALIVDDVVTTGATLRESARALRASGWSVLGAATIAATPRRFPAFPLVRHT